MSKFIITLNDLQYNRSNWRDELSRKDKSVARSEYELIVEQIQAMVLTTYIVNKAKKTVRQFNDMFNVCKTEVCQSTEIVNVTQAHHIFAQSDYLSIAKLIENLIRLTPNQHFLWLIQII